MAALENEVLRNPKPSLVDRSALELGGDKLLPPDIYMDRALLKARRGYDDVWEAGPLREHKLPWNDSPDSDMELVAEAKARIQELQKEAETLEEAYRNYQQRAVQSTISHMLPPRPFSPQQAHSSYHPDAHHSHIQSPHKPKVSRKQPSPQTTRIPLSESYDAGYTGPPAQLRVTFSEDHDQHMAKVFTDHSLHSFAAPLIRKDRSAQDESSAPSRRLSSTLQASRKKLQRDTGEGKCKNTSKGFCVPAYFTCQEMQSEIVSCCQHSYAAHLTCT